MTEELKSNTGSLFFLGYYLYVLGLSQKERDRLGLPPLTDAEKEFVANTRKRMEEQKPVNEESKENPEPVYNDNDKFITIRVPLKYAAPGWGLKLQKPVFPRVEIPKSEGVESWTVTKRGGIYYKFEEEMMAFGNKHGFPVLFVFYDYKSEQNGGVFTNTSSIKLFEKCQVHEAAQFAKIHETELGVFDPKEKYEQELLQQPVMDGELPLFCKNRHCTERGPQCDKCAYTAMGSRKE